MSDMLITFAPASTDHFTAVAIWSSVEIPWPSSAPKATDAVRICAAGATPSTPFPSPVPLPARREDTMVPWSLSTPTGFWPSGEPVPDASVPPTTAPRSSATVPSTPVSITATLIPVPFDVFHAVVKP